MASDFRQQIREYYDRTTASYMKHFGPTFQAVYVAPDAVPNESFGVEGLAQKDFRSSNLFLASRAGIRPGSRVLDAGCGVCGPSIDIAAGIPGVTIDAVTISPVQAEVARQRIAEAGLEGRIRVHVTDYHQLDFPAGSFDAAFFFESSGHSAEPERLMEGILRVLSPGGTVYTKDFFLKEGELTAEEQNDLADFDRLYHYSTPTLSARAALLTRVGFQVERAESLEAMSSWAPIARAMYTYEEGVLSVSEFGRDHLQTPAAFPIIMGEIKATKP